jgi:hypothetical protein
LLLAQAPAPVINGEAKAKKKEESSSDEESRYLNLEFPSCYAPIILPK